MSRNRRIAGLAAVLILTLIPSAAFAAAPSNDTRSGAVDITALPSSSTQDTADATTESNDPRGCYMQPQRSVWYRHTATDDGRLVASTAGSTSATVIEVLEQSGPSLTSITCEYDHRTSHPGAAVAFPVVKGRTYVFVVGHSEYSADPQGWDLTFSLRVQPLVEVSLDRSAFVDRDTGAVTLTGTATCSENLVVSVQPAVRQGTRNTSYAHGQSYVDCTPETQRFDIRVRKTTPRNPFSAGNAKVDGVVEVPTEAYRHELNQAASLTICTLIGTVGDDMLRGTAGADRVCGLHGDDEIATGGGNDVVFGGAGDDLIRLGGGNDWAEGGDGADVIAGKGGNDTLLGGDGRDHLVGGKGYDRCTGGAGRDTFRGCESRRQ